MFAELAHFIYHSPATLALKMRLPQHEFYDRLITRADAAGLAERRAMLVAGLSGHIVEIGCGTGAMFGVYEPPITKVSAIEPDAAFADRARELAPQARVPVEVIAGSGDAIPLPDASCDAALFALVLCSVDSPQAVCREAARVVRPGGAIRLLEHVRSPRRIAGALMHAVNPIWLRVNGQGCRLDRDPVPPLEEAGFAIEHIEPFQVWSAGMPAFPMRLIYGRRT